MVQVRSVEHWRWRVKAAQRIADSAAIPELDVRAVYLIGSTKNATAGSDSDIDLVIHVGDRHETKALKSWVEAWNALLAKLSFSKTGRHVPDLLDVHLITDADIEGRSCFAIKIGAVSDAAWILYRDPSVGARDLEA